MRIHVVWIFPLLACGGPAEPNVANVSVAPVHSDPPPVPKRSFEQVLAETEAATRDVVAVSDPALPALSANPDEAASRIAAVYGPWLERRWQAADDAATLQDQARGLVSGEAAASITRTSAAMWITIPERVLGNIKQHAGENATATPIKLVEAQLLTRWVARSRAWLRQCADTCQDVATRADAVAKQLAPMSCNCQPGDPLCSCR